MNNKILSILPQVIIIGVTLLLYTATNLFCIGNCSFFVYGRMEPLYISSLFFLPTALCLFFFSWEIFVLWTRHIAWWFSIFTVLVITNFGGGGFLNPSHNGMAIFCMSILFIITLIYAPIMSRKLKRDS
jgi:hypothetical protein